MEPPGTPCVDIDEQMIFQDHFLQSIHDRDYKKLPELIAHATKHYGHVMERVICWAELVL